MISKLDYSGSIKKRLILIILFITLFTGLVSYGGFVYWFMANQHKQIQNQASKLALVLSQDFAKLILLNEVSAAADITSKLKPFDSLNSMVLYKLDNTPIFQYSIENKSFEVEKFSKEYLSQGYSTNNKDLKLYLDAKYQNTKVGYVQLNFEILNIYEVVKKDIKMLLLVFLLMVVISYFLAIVFAKKFTEPILKLVGFLEKIEHSESLNNRIDSNEKNEYGKLYMEVNRMLERIHSSHEALKIASVSFEAQSGMIITDKNKRILKVNKAFSQITGYKDFEVVSKTPSILKSGFHDKEFYDEMLFVLEKDNIWHGEITNLHKNGSIVNELLTIQAVLNDDNEVIYYVASFIDITLQKKMQESLKEQERILVHQSKMAAMGEMLENIAHQWRQPLSIISTIASGMRLRREIGILELEDSDMKEINKINETVHFLSDTIDDFRGFFKPDKDKEKFEISSCYENTLKIVNSKFKSLQINVVENTQEVEILGLENELKQVLMNIINNAKDALIQNEIENKYIFVDIYEENEKVVIEIKDNAKGVPLTIIDKIFEPYFTTKRELNGTGIGLYMSMEMVQKHMNGSLDVKNCEYEYEGEKYKGACFTIKLPK